MSEGATRLADGTSVEARWFGRPSAPLFGWVHHPACTASGAVVLCPPLFSDAVAAHPAYVELARQLAARGCAVIRFDYFGTGDAAGDATGPRLADEWVDSVGWASEVVRAVAPGPLSLAGVRMGALLAAAGAERLGGVDGLGLLDPSPSGRAFLRQQRAIHALRFGDEPRGDEVELPRVLLDAPGAASLKALRLPASPPARRTLVLVRPDDPWSGAWSVGEHGVEIERLAAGEQEAFLEVDPLESRLPWGAIGRLAEWLADIEDAAAPDAAAAPDEAGAPDAVGAPGPSIGDTEARQTVGVPLGSGRPRRPGPAWSSPGTVSLEVGDGGAMYTVQERPLRLGPVGLFGIETAPVPSPVGTVAGSGAGARRPVVVFLSSGADYHAGPSRLWVTLARQWAAQGFRCVRVDLSGLGDSPERPGQARGVLRAPEAFDDVADVVAALADDPRQVVLVGLCSGAYQALEGALELGTLGALAVNPALRFTPPETIDGGPPSPRRQLCIHRPAWIGSARAWLPAWLGAWAGGLRQRWRRSRPHAGGDEWKAVLVRRGVQVYCVAGELESRAVWPSDPEQRREWEATGRYRVDVVEGLDHALLAASHRSLVVERLTEHLHRMADAAVTAPTAPPGPASPPRPSGRTDDRVAADRVVGVR